ncbi:MAG: hypothetical protein E7600_03510 [Ruminococcaceae bacterium]|nr:hypothetical protein [Oscillospiraceae bacterium]
MKKLLGFVIVIGFVIMLGAAGSADTTNISFLTVLLLELLGVAIVLFGISALMHYKRYVRRTLLKKRLAKKNALRQNAGVCVKIRISEKELC